jgi:hypothetical protein
VGRQAGVAVVEANHAQAALGQLGDPLVAPGDHLLADAGHHQERRPVGGAAVLETECDATRESCVLLRHGAKD